MRMEIGKAARRYKIKLDFAVIRCPCRAASSDQGFLFIALFRKWITKISVRIRNSKICRKQKNLPKQFQTEEIFSASFSKRGTFRLP